MTGLHWQMPPEVVMASYPESNPFCRGKAQPAPAVSDISFEEVTVHGPTQGALVQFQGTPEVFMKSLGPDPPKFWNGVLTINRKCRLEKGE
eukprot:s3134_g2.t1